MVLTPHDELVLRISGRNGMASSMRRCASSCVGHPGYWVSRAPDSFRELLHAEGSALGDQQIAAIAFERAEPANVPAR